MKTVYCYSEDCLPSSLVCESVFIENVWGVGGDAVVKSACLVCGWASVRGVCTMAVWRSWPLQSESSYRLWLFFC